MAIPFASFFCTFASTMEKQALYNRNFILLYCANLLMAIAFYFMLPILPVYLTTAFGATKGEVGLVLAFYTIAALVIRPFTGWAVDTYGSKGIYLAAFLLFVSLFIGYPIVPSTLLMIALRFAHGLTWGVLTTSSTTIAVEIIPPARRGEGIGVFGLSMTLAMAIGPLIAITIAGNDRFLTLFISAIAISLVGFVFTQFVKFPHFSVDSQKRELNLKGLVEKSAIPISINMLLVMFSYGSVLSFIALYGQEVGVTNSGPFFLLIAVGIGISRFFGGKAFDKHGPQRVSILGLIILILSFPILALVHNPVGYHASATLMGFGFGIIMPVFQSMVNNLVKPERRGAANSTLFTCFDLGIGIGMMATGFLSDFIGLSGAFLVCAVVNVLALILFVAFSERHYRERMRGE